MSCKALLGLRPCVGTVPAGGRNRLLGLLAAGLVVLGVCPTSAGAFECPAPQDQHGPGVLRETPAQIHRTAGLLASGDVDNRVPEIVDDLRRRYPGVRNAEIMNYLVTAYCPVVAQLSGLGDAEKRSRVDRFAEQAGQVVDRR